jgi:UDP-N-acetylglucosamine acyltransferase
VPPFTKAAKEPLSYVELICRVKKGFTTEKIKEIQTFIEFYIKKNNTQAIE